jgi:predicted nucleotidyltransferase
MTTEIIRQVKPVGNTAHATLPRDWLGREVLIRLTPRKPVRERVLALLEPYLKDIEGAYLFGSHAREEATDNSDIDLLLITSKPIKIKEPGFEVLSIPLKNFAGAIRVEPLMLQSALKEAEPILNADLLERTRQEFPLKTKELLPFCRSTELIINTIEGLLDEDDDAPESGDLAYSLILRLRGVFIARTLLENTRYTKKRFLAWVSKDAGDVRQLYDTYLAVKRGKRPSRLTTREHRRPLELLKASLHALRQEIHGRARKTGRKRRSQ